MLAVLHVWLGLAGLARLLRSLGVKRRLALGLALAFVASAPMVETFQNGLIHYAAALCYLPWVLLFSLRLQDAANWATAGKLALLVGLQYLGGHAQVSWFTVGRRRVVRRGARPGTSRGVRDDFARPGPPGRLLRVGFCPGRGADSPHAGTGCAGQPACFARLLRLVFHGLVRLVFAAGSTRSGFSPQPHETNLFCGAFVLVGGLCGLTQVRDRNVRGLLVLALGGHTGRSGQRHALLPPGARVGARFCQLPPPFTQPGTDYSCIGVGHRDLPIALRGKAGRARATLAIGALVLAATLAVELRVLPVPFRASPGLVVARLIFVVGAGALLFLCLGWQGGQWSRSRRLVVIALTLLAAGDLSWSIARIKAIRSYSFSDVAEYAIDDLLRRNGLVDGSGVPPRVSFPMNLMRPNAGMRFGFSTFAGYLSLTLDRTFAFVYGMRGLREPFANTFPASNIYDAGPFPYNSMSLVLGYDPTRGQAALAPRPDPRAYLVFAAQVVPNWRDAITKMRRGHDFHRVVLLEQPSPQPIGPEPSQAASARIRHFEPERLEVEVDSPAPALLVLGEAWYPGWTAKVNGKPAPCLPGNVWMRVVPVPAGSCTVELAYASTYLPAGAALSGIALCPLVAVWAKRRRCPSPLGEALLMGAQLRVGPSDKAGDAIFAPSLSRAACLCCLLPEH